MAYRIARKKIALFCSAAGLATAGLTPTAALSQAASEEVASGDDLIVTANRRAEDVTKIPYNIAVLGGDQLAATGVNNLEDLSQQLPNLVVTSHGNQNLGAQRQVMRGLKAVHSLRKLGSYRRRAIILSMLSGHFISGKNERISGPALASDNMIITPHQAW